MKKLILCLLVCGILVGPFVGIAGAKGDTDKKSKTVTLTGILVDTNCYLKNGDIGNDHMDVKKCGTQCLKDKIPAGLLVGKDLYVLIYPAQVFADYVGEKMEITGELYGANNLVPAKVLVVKNDRKTEVKLNRKNGM